METLHIEKTLDLTGVPNPVIKMKMDFPDGIPRTITELKQMLKERKSESIINRLAGYRCIVSALKQVCDGIENYLTISDEDKSKIVGRSLWSFAVIQYAKCYSNNEGWTVTLEASATIKNEPREIKEAHKWFMDQRHSFLAHGGKSYLQQSDVFISQRLEYPFQIDNLICNVATAATPNNHMLEHLKYLSEKTLKYCDERIPDLERKIFILLMENKKPLHPELITHYELEVK